MNTKMAWKKNEVYIYKYSMHVILLLWLKINTQSQKFVV